MQYRQIPLIALLLALLCSCIRPAADSPNIISHTPEVQTHQALVHSLLTDYEQGADYAKIRITYPYQESIFPPEIAAPTFIWQDSNSQTSSWLIHISFENGHQPIYAISHKQTWEPEKKIWENIKKSAENATIQISILGIEETTGKKVASMGEVEIGIAPIGVEAAILFRQVPLPFPVKNIERVRWRLGDIASYHAPETIMEGLTVCTSCHAVSQDGRYISMEMNYNNDSGAQFISRVNKEIILSKDNFISWNDYPRDGLIPKTRGLFARMSPSASYVIGTVNEISLALLTNDYRFSQVFFPTYGILAHYSLADK